jgi:pilus assembly protein CpaB
MSPVRLIILLVAAAAAIGAVFFVRTMQAPAPASAAAPAPVIETRQILVAKRNISPGSFITVDDLRWQDWPAGSTDSFMEKSAKPDAIEGLVGAVARVALVAGEPIVPGRLVQPGDSGFMATMLPAGMRAVTVRITPESAAGGFIMPDDRVDVLLTRRMRYGGGSMRTDVILTNVRVLAIDSNYNTDAPQASAEEEGEGAEGGGQGAVMQGSRATLELSERDAGLLRAAEESGTVALSLRSVADLQGRTGATPAGHNLLNGIGPAGESIRVYRFGSQTATEQEP